jgi:hypothetical protein
MSADLRMLVSVLQNKDIRLENIERKGLHNDVTCMAVIVKSMLADRTLISGVEVFLGGGFTSSTTKPGYGIKRQLACLAGLNDDPVFDASKTKTIADIPNMWLWAFLRKASNTPIDGAIITTLSSKSSQVLRQAVGYVTGEVNTHLQINMRIHICAFQWPTHTHNACMLGYDLNA